MTKHNFRVFKTAELAIMFLSYASQIIPYEERIAFIPSRYCQTRPILLYSIDWNRDKVQYAKSINRSMMEYSRTRTNTLKERLEDHFIVILIFIRNSLMLHLILLHHPPVP